MPEEQHKKLYSELRSQQQHDLYMQHTWQIWAYLARPCAFSRMAIDEGVPGLPIFSTALHFAKRAPCVRVCDKCTKLTGRRGVSRASQGKSQSIGAPVMT